MIRLCKIILLLVVILSLNGAFCFAQSEESTPPDTTTTQGGDAGFSFKFSLGLGVESFLEGGDDVAYQKLSLAPDFGIGPFGVGIDLAFHYRFQNGNLILKLDGDWAPPTDKRGDFVSWMEIMLAKIKYIRYGEKGDPLFLKLGSIDDGTLGNGFIMGDYSNTLFLPEKRIFGLSADLDGELFGFPLVGLETHVGNLGAFDVIGGRFFVRPLVFFDIPIISALQVGGEIVADRDPYKYSAVAGPADAMALFFGGDLRLPILDSDIIGLAVFGDVASYKGKAMGEMVGFGGSLFNLILYGAQIRFIGNGFIPVYFDPSYDVSRKAKYDLIESGSSPGYTAWLATLGFTFLNDSIVFSALLDGPFGTVDSNPLNFANYPHLRGVFTVAEGIMPGLSFDAIYDKTFLREFKDIVYPEGALAMLRLNYKIDTVLITFFYNLRFTTDNWTTPEITSGLETAIQLF